MTKLEALAKDCIENHTHKLVDKPTKQDIYLREESIFIQGYRQSEKRITKLEKENKELKELVEKYRQAVDKCLHITFMGGGCEVNTIGQYATLVDGYLTDVEGLAKWKD